MADMTDAWWTSRCLLGTPVARSCASPVGREGILFLPGCRAARGEDEPGPHTVPGQLVLCAGPCEGGKLTGVHRGRSPGSVGTSHLPGRRGSRPDCLGPQSTPPSVAPPFRRHGGHLTAPNPAAGSHTGVHDDTPAPHRRLNCAHNSECSEVPCSVAVTRVLNYICESQKHPLCIEGVWFLSFVLTFHREISRRQ